MSYLDLLVEKQIQEAQLDGKFDNLPGAGQRLILDDDSQVPDELRMSYRILKMTGFLPEPLQIRKDALNIAKLISHATDSDTRKGYATQLEYLKLKLQNCGLSTDFLDDYDYGEEIKGRLLKHDRL